MKFSNMIRQRKTHEHIVKKHQIKIETASFEKYCFNGVYGKTKKNSLHSTLREK